MEDSEIVERIGRLAEEEHALEEAHAGAGEGLSAAEVERLRELQVALDQCWDLLRQRRARRDSGLDPEEAQVRDPGVVEGYQQ